VKNLPRTISVIGTGTAEAAPDLLTLSIGVDCHRQDVAAAYGDAGRLSGQIAATLRQFGVGAADISTTGLNVRADLVWQEGRGQTVTGYIASSILQVRLRDFARSAEAIAAAVEAGGNDVRLNGLERGFADPAAVQARAREAAWRDALATGQQYAALSGTVLGKVVSLTQQPPSSIPIPVVKMERAVAADSLTVEAGESSVNAHVNVVWELRSAD
jgi:uncharacterized protein YggE